MQQIRETLYGEPKNGKIKQWAVYVEGAEVVVEWGRVGGKLQTKNTLCKSKNIGRANETSPEEQALLEAEAKWVKQHDNKLYRPTPEEALKVGQLLPMLAMDGSKKPDKIKYPCIVQPKLDGVRCMVYFEGDELKAISRQGKFYELPEHIINAIKPLMIQHNIPQLDGELYHHTMPLQNIVSAVRNLDNPDRLKLTYKVFDLPKDTSPAEDRSRSVVEIFRDLAVPLKLCATAVHLQDYVTEYINLGYEGLMVRNLQGKYEFNHRSNDLIKVKRFHDSEARVEACYKDKNGEGVLTCYWPHYDVNFDVKMKGTKETRAFEEQQKLIGGWINFTYQALTNANRPQFPVGQYVRLCNSEGEPLE